LIVVEVILAKDAPLRKLKESVISAQSLIILGVFP